MEPEEWDLRKTEIQEGEESKDPGEGDRTSEREGDRDGKAKGGRVRDPEIWRGAHLDVRSSHPPYRPSSPEGSAQRSAGRAGRRRGAGYSGGAVLGLKEPSVATP